jgi:hypothetical protein
MEPDRAGERRGEAVTVVRHVGPWKRRWYRAVAAVQSAWMFAVIWRRMPWHYRMSWLAEWEEISDQERGWFPKVAGRYLRRGMFGMRLGRDTEELETMQPPAGMVHVGEAETRRMADEPPTRVFDAAARDAARAAGMSENEIVEMYGPPPEGDK